ncbi:hypothetical protein ACWC0C_43075 [Streptomyces sp. NPDC001709]
MDAQQGGQAGTGPTGERAGDGQQDRPQQRGFTGVRRGQPLDLFGERHCGAGAIQTPEAAYQQLDDHGPAAYRSVRQTSDIPPVNGRP